MKKKGIYLGVLVMVLVFGMTVIGCDIPDEENIIGEWKKPGYTLTFKSENTVVIWTTAWGTNISTYGLNGKTLEITDSKGDSYTGAFIFERVDQESKMIISGFNAPLGSNLYNINGIYTKK